MNNSTLGGTKKTKNNWNDKIYGNDPAEGSEDELRVGRVVMMSEDKNFLRKNLNRFKKTTGPTNVQHQANKVKRTKGNTTTPPIATKTRAVSVKGREGDPKKSRQIRRQIYFNNAENMSSSTAATMGDLESEQSANPSSLQTEDDVSVKHRLQQENDDLKRKVARLEKEKEGEKYIVNGQITELEEQLYATEQVSKQTETEVRYLARFFCVEGCSVIGLMAYLGELIDLYNLPWTPREVMRSMKDIAATCARTGWIWPHTVLWADCESPERALHYEWLQAAQGRREARMALPNQQEQFVIQDQGLVAVIGGFAPDGDIMPAQLEINGFHGLQDQTPELGNEGLPELDALVPNLEEPEVRERMVPEEIPGFHYLYDMDAFLAELIDQ
ncbi:Uncharacterized protein APZ42_013073 [Daphnia magna]|uniref:Uncharacterized protein n=1 Tax=Daphnia magna TaxID=35525 RepID=A0A162R6P0_9CRUS|nr:Uncharacterized protein APZ42_013073 [Daphnia magna]